MLFSRRHFLCGATAASLSVPFLMQRLEAEAASTGKILVIVDLNGGNDMFNTVVPLQQFGTYNDLRTNIAFTQSALAATAFDPNVSTPANQASQYAFHPWMTALRTTWGTGKLALVTGVGLPSNTNGREDHETARFCWQSGTINEAGIVDTGWAGLITDQIAVAGGTLPVQVSCTNYSPIVLAGRKNSPLVVGYGDLSNFRPNFGGSSSADNALRAAALTSNNAYALASMPAEFARATATETQEYVTQIATILSSEPLSNYSTTYAFGGPGTTATTSNLKVSLEQVARMILSGSTSRVYYVSQGGYDTHSNQVAAQAPLLGELSDALAQFNSFINQSSYASIGSNVVAMTFTDFGRRPGSNSSAGTDHGTTQISFVVGASVVGGIYGTYPNLSTLDNNGNAAVGIDFRNEIADLCTAMGADPSAVVGQTYPKIGFI